MRFGVCSPVEYFGIIKEAGYDYIEYNFAHLTEMDDDELRTLSAELDKYGFKAETYNGFFKGSVHILDDSTDYGFIKEYAEKGFFRASALGGKIAVIGSGKARSITTGCDIETARERFARTVSICGDAAKKYGMTVVIEPLNRSETNFINTVEQGLDFCRFVGHKNVKCLADFFHIYKSGETLDAIKNNGGLLSHVHIAAPRDDRTMPTVKDIKTCKVWAEALRCCGYNERISLEGELGDFTKSITEIIPILDLFRF